MTATVTDSEPPAAVPTTAAAGSTPPAPSIQVLPERMWPTAGEWVDIGLLAGLIACGLYGYRSAFGGVRYIAAGILGMLLGLVVAHVCARKRQPAVVVAAAAVVAFILFGAVAAVPDTAIAGILPSPATVTALADGVVRGWANLLTIVPPVGSAANLLTVPYTCGLLAGLLALTVTERTRRAALALVFPLAVLVLSVLFGTNRPASVVLQGAVFGALSIAWISRRQRARRVVSSQGSARNRLVGSVVVLALAGALGLVLGPRLPGADANERFVLRDRTEPPFDPHDYPSPLNGYRHYTDSEQLRDTTLFRVQGLPDGARLRLAVMDAYDGVVFNVGVGAGASGYFQRVGESMPVDAAGREATVTLTVEDYADVWVPTVGEPAALRFEGRRGADLADSLRMNLATDTGATPLGLQKGDSYTIEAVIPEEPGRDELLALEAAQAEQPAFTRVEPVSNSAQDYVAEYLPDGSEETAGARAVAIAAALTTLGGFSDGDKATQAAGGYLPPPGHSARRLTDMLPPDGLMVGNGEQYAAMAALMSRSLGVPTRVVMGFAPPAGAEVVTGADVAAWIEVSLEGRGWVPLYEVTPSKDQPEPQPQPQPKEKPNRITPPPPPTSIPLMEEGETQANKTVKKKPKKAEDDDAVLGIPRIVLVAGGVALAPFVLVGGFTAGMGGLKARRRLQRRSRGPVAMRISGGWREIEDLAVDLGRPIPARLTRREAGRFLASDSALDLARLADAHVFGPGFPDESSVDAYWMSVDATRAELVAPLNAFQRWKAFVNPSSLLHRLRGAPSWPGARRWASLQRRPSVGAPT